jgi:hypothetical protein
MGGGTTFMDRASLTLGNSDCDLWAVPVIVISDALVVAAEIRAHQECWLCNFG